MINVNYKAINKLLDKKMKAEKIKNRSSLFVKVASEMGMSYQHCWALIDKQKVNTIKQVNLIASVFGVDVMDIITINPVTERPIISQIH